MNLELVRYAYHHSVTLGGLRVGDDCYFTIERPWVAHHSRGGKPFESCIPDGDYALIPFQRSNGDKVYALENAGLGVHLEQRPDLIGRYAILLHSGNWASDVVGCIAPGLHYKIDQKGRHMVTNSRAAMSGIMDALGFRSGHHLTIRCTDGAVD